MSSSGLLGHLFCPWCVPVYKQASASPKGTINPCFMSLFYLFIYSSVYSVALEANHLDEDTESIRPKITAAESHP